MAELAFSTPRALSTATPKEGNGANAGLYLPRAQFDGEIRLPWLQVPDFDFGLIATYGHDGGATAITPDQPRPRGGATWGGGGTSQYSIPLGPDFRLGLSAMLALYTVPYIEYRTCVSNCGGVPFTDIESGSKTVGVASGSLTPSYRNGPLVIFGSVTARNHPTNTKGEVTNDPLFDSDDEVRNGPLNVIAAVGAEFMLPQNIKVLAQLFMPLTRNPVSYAPTIGLAIALPLGRREPGALMMAPPASGPTPMPADPYAPAPMPQ